MKINLEAILKKEARKLTIAISASLVAVFLFFAAFSSYQANKTSCAMFESLKPQFLGPLAREISLGEMATSNAIFNNFMNELGKLGLEADLKLIGFDAPRSPSTVCTMGLMSATISAPITFADTTVARIEGTIGTTQGVHFMVVGGLIILAIGLSLRVFVTKLGFKLQKNVVAPIRKISDGYAVSESEKSVTEVFEIENNFNVLKQNLLFEQNEKYELLKEKEFSEFARQIAHDIQSPLSALSTIESDGFDFTGNKKMLLYATNRIRSIANLLVDKHSKKSTNELTEPCLVYEVIENVINEKRIQFPRIEMRIEAASRDKFVFSNVEKLGLSRVLSNILQNAVEAVDSAPVPQIKTIVSTDNGKIKIVISDNGIGIPKDILPTLMKKGVSYAKPTGYGLGLHSAIETLNQFGGSVEIASQVGVGTTVEITLLTFAAPPWFACGINFKESDSFIVIDDDPALHELWKKQLSPAKINFYNALPIIDSADHHGKVVLYLVDYDLGPNSKSGLEFIKENGLAKKSILVTSQYDKSEIQADAAALGLKILPKGLITDVQVQRNSPEDNWDLVLIDDDDLVHDAWMVEAKRSNKKLRAFFSWDELSSCQLNKQTPVFIDYSLRAESGLEVAKAAYDSGFQSIYLATGLSPDDIGDLPPYLKSVLGKGFPHEFCRPWVASHTF